MSLNPETKVCIVDPGIGGGHHTFGFALEKALIERGVNPQWITACELEGASKFYWGRVRSTYEAGGKGGVKTNGYELTRAILSIPLVAEYGKRALTGHLGKYLQDFDGTLISTHSLTAIRAGHTNLVLLQGDVNGGDDYAVRIANKIAVPLPESLTELTRRGIHSSQIAQVGFFVDDAIKAPEIIERRIDQLTNYPIHIGIYFTGALPEVHVRLIRDKLLPGLAPIMKRGEAQVTIYTFTNGVLAEKFLDQGRRLGVKVTRRDDDESFGDWDVRVIYGDTVRDAIDRSLKAAGDLNNPISLLTTMPGERFPWVGGMAIAPFAPINKSNTGGNTEYGIKHQLFKSPAETEYLPDNLLQSRRIFVERIRRGVALIPTNGAENLADMLVEELVAS